MSKIEWTEKTWSPVRGCSRISPGCQNCYAERMAARFSTDTVLGNYPVGDPRNAAPFAGFSIMTPSGPRWTGRVELIPHMLDIPLKRHKPTTFFVNSMSDLFHESLPPQDIFQVAKVMARCPRHRFQILTKRSKRMAEIWPDVHSGLPDLLEHVWMGVSAENQQYADERIPHLLATPAAVRFVSLEPLLGPMPKLEKYLGCAHQPKGGGGDIVCNVCGHAEANPAALDWVIVGGESGPGARPCDIEWIRDIVRQCKAAGVPCFVKQDNGPRSGLQGRIPDDLWACKEMP